MPGPKVKKREELVIFTHLANLSDLEWGNFFRTCATGKFPPKVKLGTTDGQVPALIFRRGAKTVVHTLPDEATPVELEKCKRFFQTEVGLNVGQGIAPEAMTVSKDPLARRLQQKKKLRNYHLLLYVNRLGEAEGLTKTQQDQLFAVLVIGLLGGSLTHTDIVIGIGPDGRTERIETINRICRRLEDGTFYIEVPPGFAPKPDRSSTRMPPIITFHQKWLEFTGQIRPKTRRKAIADSANSVDEATTTAIEESSEW